ncbi:hypothetical protein [Sphingobacterium sp. E70]
MKNTCLKDSSGQMALRFSPQASDGDISPPYLPDGVSAKKTGLQTRSDF